MQSTLLFSTQLVALLFAIFSTQAAQAGNAETTQDALPDMISAPEKMLLMYGDSRKIEYVVTPPDAYVRLAWSSDNPSVVKVEQDGTVEAVGGGKANVTVMTQNDKSATVCVEVPEPDFRMHVWLRNGMSVSYPMASHPKVRFPGEKVVLSGEAIDAEFDKADFGRFTFSNDMVSPMPTGIDMPSALTLSVGDRYRMPYALQPEDFDFVTTLTWTTTDSCVASVDAAGEVAALGSGDADIVCEASNGCRAQCHVSVSGPDYYFVVWLKDGRKIVTHLREKPMMKYDTDAYTLVASAMETRYDAADIAKITLADNPDGAMTGIDGVSADGEGGSRDFELENDRMLISGGRPGAVTRVFSVSGVPLGAFGADDRGCTMVPLSDLPKGVLIIRSEKLTYKIIKK